MSADSSVTFPFHSNLSIRRFCWKQQNGSLKVVRFVTEWQFHECGKLLCARQTRSCKFVFLFPNLKHQFLRQWDGTRDKSATRARESFGRWPAAMSTVCKYICVHLVHSCDWLAIKLRLRDLQGDSSPSRRTRSGCLLKACLPTSTSEQEKKNARF